MPLSPRRSRHKPSSGAPTVATAAASSSSCASSAWRSPSASPCRWLSPSSSGGRPRALPTEAITRRTCGVTLYPKLCVIALTAFPGAGDAELVPMSLNATHRRVANALYNAKSLAGATAAAAYGDCVELLDAAGRSALPPPSSVDDDDVITSHDTYQESLDEVNAGNDDRIRPQMLAYISNLGEHLSNSLAIFAARGRPDADVDATAGGGFPRWMKIGVV
uniref:Pectinesterase inhibitor domain-containing protein n=1 Tax=Leersia perrieri TaxID=77586 RepID=A0A0D9UYL9_9ORYZ